MTNQRPHDDLDVAQTAQDELAEMEARWKRAAADLANYRKRAERDLAQQRQHEREVILRDWLPMVDNLERALGHQASATLESLRDGLEAIRQQTLDILGHYGVSRLQTIGTRFDPAQHEAVSLAPGTPEGTILDEVSPGYLIGETTLRPAQVIVAAAETTAEGHDGI
jgi:molecular chaperone GrpE